MGFWSWPSKRFLVFFFLGRNPQASQVALLGVCTFFVASGTFRARSLFCSPRATYWSFGGLGTFLTNSNGDKYPFGVSGAFESICCILAYFLVFLSFGISAVELTGTSSTYWVPGPQSSGFRAAEDGRLVLGGWESSSGRSNCQGAVAAQKTWIHGSWRRSCAH